MAKRNPPSRTTIRGQRHLLAYITPAEAELLKSRGGTGEFHKGVPSYPPGFGGERSGFGSERSGGAAGGRSGAGSSSSSRGGGGPSSSGRGGGRSGAGMGGGRDDGGRGYSGPDRGGDEMRPGSKTPEGKKNTAQKQLDKQIALGKTNIEKMTTSDKLIAAFFPFAGIETVQNYAAQFMGNRMKDVLSKEGSRAVYDKRTGRVSGVYDSLGRLTGRDFEAEEREAKANIGRDNGPRRIIKPEEEEEKATLGKKVIRTDLTKEIEAERIRRRKAGLTQLGNRTLLSSNSTLGA